MTDLRDRYTERADAFTAVVDSLPVPAWDAPSPCAGWTATDIVAHVVDTQRDFLGQQGVALGDRPAGSPAETWAAHSAAVDAIDDDVLAREYDGYFGATTVGATLADFYGFDLIVHRWDIARAAGRDAPFTDTELDAMERSIAVFGEALYGDGICARPVADDADRATHVLALLGRVA